MTSTETRFLLNKFFPCLLTAAVLAGGGVANATVLTFDIDGATDYSDIPATYGDNVTSTTFSSGGFSGSYLKGNNFTPNITVDYRTVNSTNNSTVANNLDLWTTNYGDLTNIAFPIADGLLGEISLVPAPGQAVTLNSFDLGGYSRTDQANQTVRILDEEFNILQNFSPINVEGNSGHSSFTPNITSSSTIRIQFGPSWNTGIDNINFDQNVTPVPFEFSPGLGILVLGIWGGMAQIKSLIQKRKLSRKEFFINS